MLSCLDRAIEKYEEKIFVPVRWFITFLIVSILWLLFSAESIFEFKEIMLNILYMQNTAISSKIIDSFVIPEIVFLLKIFHLSNLCEKIRGFNMIILTILSFAICLVPDNNYRNKTNSNAFSLILSITCFVLGVYALNTESVYVYYGF